MIPEDEEPTEEERAEAEALARALDRGHRAGPGPVPGEALETAAFLRFAKDGGLLDDAKSTAILKDATSRARSRGRPSAARWSLLGALGLAAAAGASFLLLRPVTPDVVVRLPPPSRTLLEAQADIARSGAPALATLRTEMVPYRAQMYAALEERYRR